MRVYDYIFFFSEWPISKGIQVFIKIYLMTELFNDRLKINLFGFVSINDQIPVLGIKNLLPVCKYN